MHGDSRKPASFVDLEEVTVSLLRDVARNLFDLKDGKVILRTYSKTFEEFVDAEDVEVIGNGDKSSGYQAARRTTNKCTNTSLSTNRKFPSNLRVVMC